MIELEGVRFRYRESGPGVLERVSFTVRDGERWLVVGPSGSGKSTLLRLFNGLVPHFHGGVLAGRVRVAGRDPVTAGPAAMSDAVGFVFQNPEAQFVAERVEDEVAFALENHGVAPDEMSRRIGRVLERLGMRTLRRRRLSTLSGGERQRVALAGALVLRPRLLLLDEPTSQLDPRAAEELLHLLDRLHRETGLTVVLSEHRVERVAQWADRVCRFGQLGEPPRIGAPREVLIGTAPTGTGPTGTAPTGTALAPPVARLGSRLGWRPVPLTVDEAKTFLPARRAGPTSAYVEEPVEAAAVAGGEGTSELLRARELTFRYPGAEADAVDHLDLSLRRGERTALMGPNGSGKSTLLKLLVGLLSPSDGTVEIRGRDTAELDLLDRTGSVGFVPQNPSRLLFNESAAEEIRYTRRSHGLPPAPEQDGVPRPLARLGLARYGETHPFDLSTGERQRLALAAILAAEPEVLLLDEPTRGLDPDRKEELARLLDELAEAGVAVLLATHDVELVAGWAKRLVVLEEGCLSADGPASEVLGGDVGERLGLRPQVLQLFGDPTILTVEDALERRPALGGGRP